LIWGKEMPGDGAQENQYLRAARLVREWEEEGILIQEQQESIYLYGQDFAVGKGMRSRRGLIAKVKLKDGDSDAILRHEDTFAEQRRDRLDLIRATSTNLDSIFALYEGGGGLKAIMDEEMNALPLLDIRDRWGVRQRLWALQDSGVHAAIQQELAPGRLFIADGHHRYESALQYSRERTEYDHVMMTLIGMDDPGLIILPYHRLLRDLPGWDLKEFLQKARQTFAVQEVKLPRKEEEREEFFGQQLETEGSAAHRFALYAGGDSFFLLSLPHSQGLPQLEVSVLDDLILQGILGLQGADREEKVSYTHDLHEALREVEGGAADLAVLLRPTSLKDLKSISLTGKKMPQKSTYFYPKLLSGLVIHRLGT
jgi:uncharacterized protein (DUF1015 family)